MTWKSVFHFQNSQRKKHSVREFRPHAKWEEKLALVSREKSVTHLWPGTNLAQVASATVIEMRQLEEREKEQKE